MGNASGIEKDEKLRIQCGRCILNLDIKVTLEKHKMEALRVAAEASKDWLREVRECKEWGVMEGVLVNGVSPRKPRALRVKQH